MRCPQCGHDNGAAMKFCGECGTRLVQLCSECGARNVPTQKFCGECGARLATAATVRQPSPQEYTPKHLAERILSSKAALEGERKQVTVLFADLKGSMELVACRDSEEAATQWSFGREDAARIIHVVRLGVLVARHPLQRR